MGQWVGSGHITKNQINLELIKIIQFCLKICDLLRLMADRVIFEIGWVVYKVCVYTMKGQ